MVRHAAKVAHFRKLCCLGLGGQAIVPALLKVLHELIPFRSSRFCWCDSQGELTGCYAEDPAEYTLGEVYFREFDGKIDHVWPSLKTSLKKGAGAGYTLPFQNTAFYRSDYYNLLERPNGTHAFLDAIIADTEGLLGAVMLVRELRDRLFTSTEQVRLRSLIPYFAHGMRDPGNTGGALSDRGRAGLIVADRRGHIRYTNGEGMHLLTMATCPQVNVPRKLVTPGKMLPPELMSLCSALCRIADGEIAPPPSRRQTTRWGCFEFRASWLLDHFNSGDPLVAITIELRVPRKLTLMQAMHTLGLSDRQKDVCLLMAERLQLEEIARRLSVRLTTVVDHVDKIYVKLGVRDRASLLSVLLAERRSRPRKGSKQLLATRLN